MTEQQINQNNLPGNRMDFSVLKEFYSEKPYRNFSIKYVLTGTEYYSVNGRKHEVADNEYLLANKYSEGYAEVNSKQFVKGLCIDLSQDTLSEVVATFLKPDAPESDTKLDTFFNTDSFLENKYLANSTELGVFLMQQASALNCNTNRLLYFNKEFYYTVAEKIVMDHVPIFKQLQQVKALKPATKKDLFLKLKKAKEFLDSYFLLPLKTNEAAAYCGLSEYHFYRLYKSTFLISPHQYVLQKRLNYAHGLLKMQRSAITEIACACGFTDIFTFSKAFKKHFGYSPKHLTVKNSRI